MSILSYVVIVINLFWKVKFKKTENIKYLSITIIYLFINN